MSETQSISNARWKSRWEKARVELSRVRRENILLREALDDLNSDTEALLNHAALDGIERAKSHAIRTLLVSNRRLKREQVSA